MKTIIEISDLPEKEEIETTLSFSANLEGEEEPNENTLATPSMLIGSYISHLISTGEIVELANSYFVKLNAERNNDATKD